ncbi:phage baseplate assembly protein V [Caballeronia zhejiangensis]|uniref:Baseplate assembly protein n=1 Tax=Caballeronia zhejiangensis TaxID=871203 RepID=A0A656QEY6_9BURK|nr:phage baseplate assembly protein V [Caballeronia zhejiangensis]KDR25424.1 baseplate assembly protein [Caballeronia zhejiangensis]
MLDALNALSRRIRLFVSRAVISYVDDTRTVQYLQAKINALETVGDIPRYVEYGLSSNPPLGSEALIVFGNGERTNGIVIATSNAKYRVTALASGEVVVHDNTGQKVYLSQAGMVLDGGGKPVTITNTPEIDADTPLLKCKGDIIDNYETNTRTVAGMRQVANLHTHPIVNVQTGGSTINTQPPTQPE